MEAILSILDEREELTKIWAEALTGIYPEDFRRFLRKTTDRFANPIGYTVTKELPVLFECLISNKIDNRLNNSLETLMKLMAVQDISPSNAILFLFQLKEILLKRYVKDSHIPEDLNEILYRIDNTALLSFDIYMKTREKIFEIKANEVKNRFEKMVGRLNKKYSLLEEE